MTKQQLWFLNHLINVVLLHVVTCKYALVFSAPALFKIFYSQDSPGIQIFCHHLNSIFHTPLAPGKSSLCPSFSLKKPDPFIYMICEAFGLHLGGISLILPTPKCYCNYSREGIESISSYCQLLSLCILLFLSFVKWERRSLTSRKGSIQDNEQDLKGGHRWGARLYQCLVGFVTILFPSQHSSQLFLATWPCKGLRWPETLPLDRWHFIAAFLPSYHSSFFQ